MKKYTAPTLSIRMMARKDVIVTSTPGIMDTDADPGSAVLGKERGGDWDDFEK